MTWRLRPAEGTRYEARNERTGETHAFSNRAAATKFVKAHDKKGGEQTRMFEGPKQATLFNPTIIVIERGGRVHANPQVLRNVAGFVDSDGTFHPIRGSAGYDPRIERANKKNRTSGHRTAASTKRRASTTPAGGKRKPAIPGANAALKKRLGITTFAQRAAAAERDRKAPRGKSVATYKGKPYRSKVLPF